MREFDWKAFENKEICVSLPNAKLAKDFLREAGLRGMLWSSGANPLTHIEWAHPKEETVYYGKNGVLTFGSRFNVRRNVSIIKWELDTFSFEEVIARIKNGEKYVAVKSFGSVRSIYKSDDNVVIVGDGYTNLLVNESKYVLESTGREYRIVTVKHSEHGKNYDFISELETTRGDFVSCDTRYGLSFGRVENVKYIRLTDDETKKYKRIVRVY